MAQDQMQPTEQAAPAESGGDQGGDQMASLLQNVTQGIAMLTEVVGESGIDPQLTERLAAVQAEMDGIVDTIAGGGAQQQAPAGQAPMEAGATGQPMSPASR